MEDGRSISRMLPTGWKLDFFMDSRVSDKDGILNILHTSGPHEMNTGKGKEGMGSGVILYIQKDKKYKRKKLKKLTDV